MLVLRILIALRFDNAGADNYSECGKGQTRQGSRLRLVYKAFVKWLAVDGCAQLFVE